MQIEYLSLFVDFSLSGSNEYLWNLISNYNFFGKLISHFNAPHLDESILKS